MGSSVNVALPAMGRNLSLNAVQLGWVNLSFLLASVAFSIPFGRIGDIFGRKKIYMIGLAVFTVASVAIALSTSGVCVIAGRALQGFGSAMIFSTGMAILISVYPPEQRGRVLGINVGAVYLGLSMGPFVGGIVTEFLSWRHLFWLNLPIGVILLFITATMLKGEWAEDRGAAFDWIGSLVLAASLTATLYGFSDLPHLSAIVLLAAGLVGLVYFVFLAKRLEQPLIDVRLFYRNRVFALSSLAALINYAATFAVTFLISLYLQKVRGFSPNEAGMVLVSQPLVQAILSPLAGRLSDRIEPRIVASVGMLLCFIGVLLLNFVGAATSIWYLLGCLLFLGLGFAFFSSPNTKAIMNAVDRRIYGVASAVVGTARQMGMTFSMGIVMMIIAIHLGQAEVDAGNTEAFLSSMRTSFITFATLCGGGVFASMARGRSKQ
jgi:EmrB/QacA subfamily drug resistance transporter